VRTQGPRGAFLDTFVGVERSIDTPNPAQRRNDQNGSAPGMTSGFKWLKVSRARDTRSHEFFCCVRSCTRPGTMQSGWRWSGFVLPRLRALPEIVQGFPCSKRESLCCNSLWWQPSHRLRFAASTSRRPRRSDPNEDQPRWAAANSAGRAMGPGTIGRPRPAH
jgi:hypothetical protein